MKYFNLLLISVFTFCTQYNMSAQDIMMLKTSGKVVIGDTAKISTPGNYNLYVQNGILTERVKVSIRETDEWSDNAFSKTPSIQQVDHSIKSKSHLFEMPSAEELVENGYELKSMDAKLLQQIEWLWQHTISLQQKNELLEAKIDELSKQIEINKE